MQSCMNRRCVEVKVPVVGSRRNMADRMGAMARAGCTESATVFSWASVAPTYHPFVSRNHLDVVHKLPPFSPGVAHLYRVKRL